VDYDKGLVAALLREGPSSVRKARQLVPLDYLTGDGKKALEFVQKYTSDHRATPSLQLVQQHTRVDLDPDPIGASNGELDAPSSFWIDNIVDRRLHTQLQKGLQESLKHLQDEAPKDALFIMEKALQEIRKDRLATEAKVETLGPLSKKVWQYYLDIQAGKRGILSPWATINDMTLGFWPGDLALFVARIGVGKTWAAVLLANAAWTAGHKVLFATTEISRVRIAMRFLCVHYRLNYRDFRMGRLTDFSEAKLKGALKEIMDDANLYVAGGDFDFQIDNFATCIEEIDPEFIIVDGAYLLRVEGKNRNERAANAFDELKRIANRYETPIAATTQFNREAKQNVASTAKLENIGLTDVAGQNADLAFALMQTDDMKREKRLTMNSMKVREGEGKDLELNWDFETMNFSERPAEGAGDAVESDYIADDSDGDNTNVPF
jgi:replicative DNA helicase